MRLVIFDIDGVLVRGSTEREFFKYLLRHGTLGFRQLLTGAACFLRYLPAAGLHVGKVNKGYLAGLRSSELDALGERFIEEWVDKNWYHPALSRLREHQQRNDSVMLMSGTLEQLARPMAERLRVRHVLSTLLSQRDGILQSRLPVVHPFAWAKRVLGEKVVRDLELEWRQVTAYGDSYYDLPLLEAVGEPVAVRPDAKLRRVAIERNWEIIEHGDAERSRADSPRGA